MPSTILMVFHWFEFRIIFPKQLKEIELYHCDNSPRTLSLDWIVNNQLEIQFEMISTLEQQARNQRQRAVFQLHWRRSSERPLNIQELGFSPHALMGEVGTVDLATSKVFAQCKQNEAYYSVKEVLTYSFKWTNPFIQSVEICNLIFFCIVGVCACAVCVLYLSLWMRNRG